jgi:hypothetical protein
MLITLVLAIVTALVNFYYYRGLLFTNGSYYFNTSSLLFTRGYGFIIRFDDHQGTFTFNYYYDNTGDLLFTIGHRFIMLITLSTTTTTAARFTGRRGPDTLFFATPSKPMAGPSPWSRRTWYRRRLTKTAEDASKPLAGPSPWSGYGRQLTLVEDLERERRPCSVLNGQGP